jgi:hypothetical protein
MTTKEWLADNPDVTMEQVVNELIEWRERAKTYQKQLIKANNQLAEIRYIVKRYSD